MVLTDKEKASRKRDRMIETSLQWQLGTHAGKVAKVYQRMIRAEAAALPPGPTPAIVEGELAAVIREVGQVVCVTCGKVAVWNLSKHDGEGGFDTGHYEGGRTAAVLFADHNAHPQCVYCNRTLGGNGAIYKLWIKHVYGADEPERLERLRYKRKQFTHDELVDMQIGYAKRLKTAETSMQ